uniref:MADF domain-containing protein n=1 Tax=Anopheles funestus TaxID=62324 RepID=A0A182RXX4_ANOFN
NHEQCLHLIEAVRNETVIWNKKNKNFINKAVQNTAWRKVVTDLELTTEHAKYVKVLLSCHRTYRSKVKKSQVAGSALEDVYTPNWFAYEAMMCDSVDVAETLDT